MKDADNQLRATIEFFEDTEEAGNFDVKLAYICNSLRPKAKESFGVRTQSMVLIIPVNNWYALLFYSKDPLHFGQVFLHVSI